jgi:hypothetical protein
MNQKKLSVEAVPSDEIASSVDGVHLLGIFGSGEVAGAIIRLDNGERQRMSVGDSVEGWILQSLEPRGALFEAATGQRALLQMAFSTDQSADALPAPAAPPKQSVSSEQPLGSSNDSAAVDAEASPRHSTFGDVYRRRQLAEESGEK